MPPLPLIPNQPPGAVDIVPGAYGYGASMYPGAGPSAQTDQQRWDAYVETIKQAIRESAGFQRWQLEQQLADAERGRANAYKIAEMQSQTSRYGTDKSFQSTMAQLKENARQFDLRHGLEQQQLGLQRAETATNFLSSPDRYAQAGNFLALSSRVLSGQAGAGTYGTAVAPRANTMQDFAVLESGGNPYSGRGNAAAAASAGGAGGDARQKALQAVIKGYTPSDGVGLDANDYAVLNASRAIMNMNLTPKQQATINSNPEYQGILASNIGASGQNAQAWWKRQQQGGVGQGNSRAA